MKKQIFLTAILGLSVGFILSGCGGANHAPTSELEGIIHVETLTERCSGDVYFPQSYGDSPINGRYTQLKRPASGYTPWTSTFYSAPNQDGFVRWWCYTTKQGLFDIFGGGGISVGGTTITGVIVGGGCDYGPDGLVNCKPSIDITTDDKPKSEYNWTAERSRCDNHSGYLRARLGPNRLLQIQCMPPGSR